MAQDIKVRNIQVEGIQSPAPQPISGDDFISVNSKLRYTSGFPLDDDYDLVYKSYLASGAVGRTFSVSLDSSGEYDFTSESIREFPCVTIYDSSGNTAPYYYNNTTKKITGGVPSEAITVTFI
jgi:hypothetical protein